MSAKLLRRVLIFALLTAGLAVAFFSLLAMDRPAPPVDLHFSRREPTQIAQVTVRNPVDSYTIIYDQAEGGYVIGDVPAELTDMDRFIQFMVDAADFSASAAVSGGGDLAAFGLDAPQAEVRAEYDDGGSLHYWLGSQELVSGEYYLRVEGREGVYTYPKAAAEAVLQGQAAFVSRQVTPKLHVSSPLSAIRDARFEGKALERPILIQAVMGASEAIRRDALSFGAATHLVRGAGTHELDQAGGIRVLGSLLGLEAIRVEGYGLSGQQLLAYGFDAPDMKVSFVIADRERGDQSVVLSLVRAGEDTFYAAVDGRSVVYLINRPAFADLRYEDLIMRYFISPMLVDVRGLSVVTPEKRYEISYERTAERQELISVNGEAVTPESFQAFYRLVTSAAADGPLISMEEPDGPPALEIIYHYKTPEKQDDVLRFYPGSPRRMAVSVNGVIELDIRESFVSRLIAACEQLLAGGPIEENW